MGLAINVPFRNKLLLEENLYNFGIPMININYLINENLNKVCFSI